MKSSLKILCALFIIININAIAQNKTWKSITEQSEGSWFATNEAKAIAENVLLYQRNIGGWPKNIQMHKPLLDEEKVELKALKDNSDNVTTANGATFQEMVFLSKMYRQVPDNEYKKAFLLGLDYILKAQYDNGGWPRTYPLKSGYFSHITYNDDSMINILMILKEIKNRTNYFSITPSDEIIKKSEIAFNKGIDCILKTQYKQNGVLTSWCGQHDAVTLQPTKARPYELPSLSGSESVSIVLFLMAIEKPSKEISDAIVNAVNWFEKVKITGLREEVILNENGKIIDKKMIPDANAPVIWSRFMELEDNRAFFSDRDGIKKYALSEISNERRIGYKWYTNEPQKVFKNYPLWKKKNNI